jgi:hypothetical protein
LELIGGRKADCECRNQFYINDVSVTIGEIRMPLASPINVG